MIFCKMGILPQNAHFISQNSISQNIYEMIFCEMNRSRKEMLSQKNYLKGKTQFRSLCNLFRLAGLNRALPKVPSLPELNFTHKSLIVSASQHNRHHIRAQHIKKLLACILDTHTILHRQIEHVVLNKRIPPRIARHPARRPLRNRRATTAEDIDAPNGSMRLTHKKTVISHKLCTHF